MLTSSCLPASWWHRWRYASRKKKKTVVLVAGTVNALATTDIAGNSVLAAGGCERVVMHDSAASRCGGTDFDLLQESLDL